MTVTESVEDCLFCRIVEGDVPATVVYESEGLVGFRDIAPQAPVHVLVIPKEHYADIAVLCASDRDLAGELLAGAADVATEMGLDGDGYRVVLNTGPDAGQAVFHVHAHVLGGMPMGWPPFPVGAR